MARQRPDMLISRVIRSVLDHETVQIHGDGSQRRDLVYVGDVVRALLAMRAKVGSEVVNVGSGIGVSVNEVLDTVSDRAGRLLDYRPTTDLRRGLAAQIAA